MAELAYNDLFEDIIHADLGPAPISCWWLGQMGWVYKTKDAIFTIDAFLSPHPRREIPPLLTPENLGSFDFIFGTHDHADHIDKPLWRSIASLSPKPKFVAADILKVRVAAECGIDVSRMIGVNDQHTITVGNVKITGIASAHEFLDKDPETGKFPHMGYVIETAGKVLYHCGDCCIYEGLLTKLKKWNFDTVFLPINGRDAKRYSSHTIGNMTFQEAVDLAGSLGARQAFPGHWDMFKHNGEDPKQFAEYLAVKYPGSVPVIPEYGKRYDL